MTIARSVSSSDVLKPPYTDLFRATSFDRIAMIEEGVPAVTAKQILATLALSQADAFAALDLSPATINRKVARDERLSLDESERVIGLAKLIGQLQAIVEESGRPEGFDAVHWISRWITEPLPALGGRCPVDLLKTIEGQALVSDTLARVQSGAYA